jgi:hypothetical protein
MGGGGRGIASLSAAVPFSGQFPSDACGTYSPHLRGLKRTPSFFLIAERRRGIGMASHPEATEHVFEPPNDRKKPAERGHRLYIVVFAICVILGAIIGYQVSGWS